MVSSLIVNVTVWGSPESGQTNEIVGKQYDPITVQPSTKSHEIFRKEGGIGLKSLTAIAGVGNRTSRNQTKMVKIGSKLNSITLERQSEESKLNKQESKWSKVLTSTP